MSKKKLYWRVSVTHSQYDYLVFEEDEVDKVLDCVQTEMENMDEEDQSVTVETIFLTDKEYAEIIENSED